MTLAAVLMIAIAAGPLSRKNAVVCLNRSARALSAAAIS
jgi:hypothetical protein